jgi:SAM-dependent methyltransferase
MGQLPRVIRPPSSGLSVSSIIDWPGPARSYYNMTLLTSSPVQKPLRDDARRLGPPSAAEVRKQLDELALKYPPDLVPMAKRDVPRMTFSICLALRHAVPRPTICDVGGGVCLFSLGLSALGYDAILIDDFGDDWHGQSAQGALGLHSRYGVQIVSTDVLAKGVSLEPGSLDVVTCFDTMEHFHHSPKRLFHQLVAALRPNGIFLLGVPNRVNLRKRVMIPFGGAPWSTMDGWYEQEIFRGHVREPDVPDLRYICRDLGLDVVDVVGRNWQGTKSKKRLNRNLARIADHGLRLFPSLCSDLYIVGRKPATHSRA